MNAIEVRGLRKSFGDVVAVDDLTFGIPAGKLTGFLGPNGAGKSTTLRMILGLVRPDAGTARILGKPYARLGDAAHAVGALLGVEQFHPARSGRNHLVVAATAARIAHTRVDEVLEMVDLAHASRRKVGGYSLGMKQRLGLAAALLGDPRVLVLDEPANGLDPAGMRWLRNFLRSFTTDGRAVFVSSHQLAEVGAMADEIVVIDRGRLVTHSDVRTLMGRTTVDARVVTPEPERLADALDARGISHERLSPDSLRVAGSPELIGQLAADIGIPLFGLQEGERRLEDVFFELTDKERRA